MKYSVFFCLLFSAARLFGQEFFTDFDNLTPGRKGYALTVFKGTEPERMDLEVVDYIPTRFNAQGMVIIKLSGDNVERSRVAAGMSGSPVFIDGKLLGALAYTWANSRELIAGVTLIEDMIKEGERGGTLPITSGAQPIQTAWNMTGIDDPELLQAVQSVSRRSPVGVEPIIFAPSRISNGVSPFKPGDSVAVKLVDGDITLASIGTVTYVNGDSVYIYGHPMDQWGTLTLPLAKAKIYTILSSTDISFKMGSAAETVGATVFDGSAAVYGRTDRDALMTPVRMNFIQNGQAKTYNFSIARSPKYLSALTGAAVGSLLTKELGKNIEHNVSLSWKMKFTNGEQVSNSVLWTKGAEYDPANLKDFWTQYVGIIWENTVSALIPEQIEMDIEIKDSPYARYSIQELRADRYDFLPGETLTLRLALGRPQEGVLLTNLLFTLPKNIKQGRYTLYAGSSPSVESELLLSYPEARALRSETEILRELRKPVNTQELRAVLVEPQTGSLSGTQFLKNIPPARRSLFRSKGILDKPISSPKLTERFLPLNRPLTGLASITINIQEIKPVSIEQPGLRPPVPAATNVTPTNNTKN